MYLRFKKYVLLNNKTINSEEISNFWRRFEIPSRFGSVKRTSEEFIQSTKNSIPLTDFSADLLTLPKKITDLNIKDIKHILICIDNKSKFCFYAFLRNKGSFEVVNAFKQVLNQINRWRKKCIFYLEVKFYSMFLII